MINAFKNEIKFLFSSKKRIIKFIGMLLIPFLYAFICIAAFWNPFAKIDKIPTAIINTDENSFCLKNIDSTTGVESYFYIVGVGDQNSWSSSNDKKYNVPKTDSEISSWKSNYGEYYIYTQYFIDNQSVQLSSFMNIKIKDININSFVFHSVFSNFMELWKQNNLNSLDLYYNTTKDLYYMKLNSKQIINLNYICGDDAKKIANFNLDSKTWNINNSKYYMHIDIPSNFTKCMLDALHQPFAIDFDNIGKYIEPMRINNFITYQKNYLSGEMLETGSYQISSSIMSTLFNSDVTNNLSDIIQTTIPNNNAVKYGIGIGQLFICVGIFVGAISMITVCDRKKRSKNLDYKKWYVAKGLTMKFINISQIIFLMFCLGCLGFFSLGIRFFYEFLFTIFIGFIFVSIVQSIWYCFRDKTIALVCCIFFLILNLSAGWGTFPSFMQFNIFEYLSYVVPFTYAIHAQGMIIFGISGYSNFIYILQMIGILLLFYFLFFSLGLFMSKKRNMEINYGSANKKILLNSLITLKMNKYLNKEKTKINFKLLPNEQIPVLIKHILYKYPLENKFKHYKHIIEIKDEAYFE